MVKEKFEKFVKEAFKGVDFKVAKIKEDDNNYFCYLYSSEDHDVPILVMSKKTNNILPEIIPPFTDDSKAKTIWEAKDFKAFSKKENEEDKIF